MPPVPSIDGMLAELTKGVTSASALMQTLGASQSWVSRAFSRLMEEGRVIRIGATRGARYGLRREVAGAGSAWPLRRVDRSGQIEELGTLYALAGTQYYFEPTGSAIERGFRWGGLSEGLPYFLQDQRPAGFLGRAVPLRYPELNLPPRVIDWSDDHYLRYLTRRGGDTLSDLILGAAAFDDYLAGLQRRVAIDATDREVRYPQFAQEVMQGGLPGSSAHGEHPKFAIALHKQAGPGHVLVKFSPPASTEVGRRWSDLLIAEHHAHQVLREAGVSACSSQAFIFTDRTYLEVDRFDRQGLDGRVGVSSMMSIDASMYGMLDNWVASATRMRTDRLIDAQTLERVRLISTFGELIANTDRHFGNLAFYDNYTGHHEIAPVYDMLPMLFAPQHDQVLAQTFNPPGPTSDTLRAWSQARTLAERYWQVLMSDQRISEDFRAISAACLGTLQALPRTGAYTYRPD